MATLGPCQACSSPLALEWAAVDRPGLVLGELQPTHCVAGYMVDAAAALVYQALSRSSEVQLSSDPEYETTMRALCGQEAVAALLTQEDDDVRLDLVEVVRRMAGEAVGAPMEDNPVEAVDHEEAWAGKAAVACGLQAEAQQSRRSLPSPARFETRKGEAVLRAW